jgi:hypothetical protein
MARCSSNFGHSPCVTERLGELFFFSKKRTILILTAKDTHPTSPNALALVSSFFHLGNALLFNAVLSSWRKNMTFLDYFVGSFVHVRKKMTNIYCYTPF